MNGPDFSKIDYKRDYKSESKHPVSYKDWVNSLEKETGKSIDDFALETMEKISVKPLYTKDDIKVPTIFDNIKSSAVP